MVKTRTVWCCSSCGHSQFRWEGQCRQCESWNTLIEEPRSQGFQSTKAIRLSEIQLENTPRVKTEIEEFDRLLGGGIVHGSLVLVGGDPGIGKSTLMLQISAACASKGSTVLYVCGEESVAQTSMRAERIGIKSDKLFLLSETNLETIKLHIESLQPNIVIIDSIQIVYKSEVTSAPGSVSQVRESTAELMHIAKGKKISIFLIGHVTKSGEIAGPRVLEHLVDTVLYFEGDKQYFYRLLRVVKNRFGATDEIAVFQMSSSGLQEVQNPSQIFLSERMRNQVGSVIIPTLEGSRPILIEIQALVSQTAYPAPARRSAGIDANRLPLLIAVLEKRVGYQLYNRDVFVSIAGGIKISEPAVDLGILVAVASSLCNRIIAPDTIVVGEVGLGGEVRSVMRMESRLKEAIQMGFEIALVPKRNIDGIPKEILKKIKVYGLVQVDEAIDILLK